MGGAGVSSGGEGDAKGRWTTRTLRAKTSSVSEKIERKTCLFSSRLMPLFLPCRGPRRKEEKRREDVTQHASSRPSGADATSTGPSQETYHDGRFPARLKYRPPLPSPPAASSQVKSLSTPSPTDRLFFVLLVSRPLQLQQQRDLDRIFPSSRWHVRNKQQLRGEDQPSGRFQAQGGEERSS